MFPIYTIIVLVSSCMCLGARVQSSLRMKGGRDVRPGEFPYIVSYQCSFTVIYKGIAKPTIYWHLCSGSVLTPTVTLTAAHCCESEACVDPNLGNNDYQNVIKFVIRHGTGPTIDDKFSEVLLCTLLPSARPMFHPIMTDDLALLTTQPIHLSKYARLSAVDYHTLYGQRVIISGYGMINDKGAMNDTLALKQIVDAMWSRCEEEYA